MFATQSPDIHFVGVFLFRLKAKKLASKAKKLIFVKANKNIYNEKFYS